MSQQEDIKKTIEIANVILSEEQVAEPKPASKGGVFSRVKRELSSADLRNPAVGRLLLSQNDKYEQEISSLEEYKEKYYMAEKSSAVFEERLKSTQETMNSKSIFLTLGGIGAGSLVSLWGKSMYFWPVAVISIIFFLLAIFGSSKKS